MMDTPAISIILCTYNRAGLVGQAIRSALAQTRRDFELIVIDDGSTDDTRAAIAAFDDARLRYHYRANGGLAAARNTGIELARGTYVTFLDDDDLYAPDHLARLAGYLDQQADCGWVSGGYRVTDMQGQLLSVWEPWVVYPDLTVEMWVFVCPTAPTAVMVRRQWLQRAGGFDPQQYPSDDWELWLRLAHLGCRMAWVRHLVCTYRLHDKNMTQDRQAMRQQARSFRVLEHFFAQPDLSADVRALQGPAYARMVLWGAGNAFLAGEPAEAVKDIQHALELDPTLKADNGRRALDVLLGFAGNFRVRDPYAFITGVIDQLPAEPFHARSQRRVILGRIASDAFFNAANREDWPAVRRNFLRLARYQPGGLKNRGVWSIGLTALVGPQRRARVRQLARSLRGHSTASSQ